MRILTLLAVAAVAAGVYHYRQRRGLAPRVTREPGSADDILAERVRVSIGGAASTPIHVTSLNGVVALRGSVRSRAERDLVLAAALAVPGVSQVTNFLETEEPVGEIGTMQSGIATGV